MFVFTDLNQIELTPRPNTLDKTSNRTSATYVLDSDETENDQHEHLTSKKQYHMCFGEKQMLI